MSLLVLGCWIAVPIITALVADRDWSAEGKCDRTSLPCRLVRPTERGGLPMGLFRKTMSVSTMGFIDWRDHSERAAAAERKKARNYDKRTKADIELRQRELDLKERELRLREQGK